MFIKLIHCYLSLQAFLPLIFLIIPMFAFIIFLSTPIEVGIYGTSVFALLYWEPIVHPLLSLCYVKPFRQKAKHLFFMHRNAVQIGNRESNIPPRSANIPHIS